MSAMRQADSCQATRHCPKPWAKRCLRCRLRTCARHWTHVQCTSGRGHVDEAGATTTPEPRGEPMAARKPSAPLLPEQREAVLAALDEGLGYDEIRARLHVADETIRKVKVEAGKAGNHIITPAEREEICGLWLDEVPADEIARRVGVKPGTVYSTAHRAGMPKRRRGPRGRRHPSAWGAP